MKWNWPEMSGLNDLSRAYEIFVEKFTLIYDKCFLLRTMKDGSIFESLVY